MAQTFTCDVCDEEFTLEDEEIEEGADQETCLSCLAAAKDLEEGEDAETDEDED